MKTLILAILAFSLALNETIQAQNKDYTQYVNPFIGTGALDTLSLSGSNFPGACLPFGLVQLSPDTKEYPDDPCSGYDYNDSTILGFSHTHLNGTGCPDLYDFLFMPFGGEIKWKAGSDDGKTKGFRSKYHHATEKASPGYYSVVLDDYNIHAEMTAIETVAAECLPNVLCAYLYDLAGAFTTFYENCPVLKSDEPIRSSRLALCELAARTIQTGLRLLGIQTVEQM